MSNHEESLGTRTILLKHYGVWQLALILAALFLVAPPAARGIGNYLLYEVAQPFQEQAFPAMAAGNTVNPVTGETEEWPPFAVDEKIWVGDDLMLYGRLCKAQPYKFVGAVMKFGYPEGPQAFAEGSFEKKDGSQPRTRTDVCQLWGPWTLKNAKQEEWKTFLFEFTYQPSHGMYTVDYIAGPFDIPPKEPSP